MTPAILTLASIAFLAALRGGWPAPVPGPSATNGFLRITMPGLPYYGGDSIVRTAVYAQERAELVIKWLVTLLAGNIAAWTTGGTWEAVAMFVAFGALVYGLQRSRPVIRLREYVGHAVEVLWVERHPGSRGYRTAEIGRMLRGYGGLFKGRDIAAGLRRAEPFARVMLVLIRPALTRFNKEPSMSDPNPIMPLPDVVAPDYVPDPLERPRKPVPTPAPTPTPTPS